MATVRVDEGTAASAHHETFPPCAACLTEGMASAIPIQSTEQVVNSNGAAAPGSVHWAVHLSQQATCLLREQSDTEAAIFGKRLVVVSNRPDEWWLHTPSVVLPSLACIVHGCTRRSMLYLCRRRFSTGGLSLCSCGLRFGPRLERCWACSADPLRWVTSSSLPLLRGVDHET